jgi:hypothetical protein
VNLGQWREGEPLGILSVPPLQFIDFACRHRVPVIAVESLWAKTVLWSCGEYVRVVNDSRRVNC